MAKKPRKPQKLKYHHLSFYKTKRGRFEIAYVMAGKRRIERLGYYEVNARRRAMEVELLLDSHKSNLLKPDELSALVKDSTSISSHLDAYATNLRQLGRTEKHVDMTRSRIAHVFDLLGIRRLSDASPGLLARILPTLSATTTHTGEAPSLQTVKHYQTAARSFFAWARRHGLTTSNPMEQVEAVQVAGQLKHRRRPPTGDELAYLLTHTEKLPAPTRDDCDGRTRATYYRLLYATGLRAREASTLDVGAVDLSKRIVTVAAEKTKNRRGAVQPLPEWMINPLRAMIAGRNAGPLFPKMNKDPGRHFRRDLEKARAAWIGTDQRLAESDFLKRRTAAGVLDLHSLRHFYVSSLIRAGVNVKDAQALARHSSAELTVGRYSHESADLGRHVDAAIGEV